MSAAPLTETSHRARPGAKLVQLPGGAKPISMSVFRGALYVTTTEGVFIKEPGSDVFRPALKEG